MDAGFAGATAMNALTTAMSSETLALFSGDELVDHRARRPRLRIDNGVRALLRWPEPELLVGSDRLGSGVAFLVGPEPDYRWRAFSAEVTGLAVELGVRLVVSLGGFPTATPHSRPVRLAATASSEALARQVGFVPGSLDVPSGIADVIGLECSQAGIPSVGLWARVPHYVSAMPFPAASLALLDGLAAISGLVIDTDELRTEADEARQRVDELIAQSEEHVAMVRQLEGQSDELAGEFDLSEEAIPSGDEIAAELERYLRGENQ